MSELHQKNCIPCRGGVPPLTRARAEEFCQKLDVGWELYEDAKRLVKRWTFKDFKTPFELTKKIGEMAEEQWHHPDIFLAWGVLEIKIWTHKINGLVESDFIFASKVDQMIESNE